MSEEPKPDTEKKEEEKQLKVPTAWGGATTDVGKGPKRWNAGARTDDPSVRIVHKPLVEDGIGKGKAFFFLFGFKRASPIDQQMLARELGQIDDDVEVLRKAGYTVVIDPQATREEFVQTVTGKAEGAEGLIPAGFYWSAHGHPDGGIECCDGGLVNPKDVDPAQVSTGLRLAIFGACYVGARSKTWRNALGGKALVVGWGRPVTIDRAVDFLQPDDATDTDLDDLIRRWLLTDAPLPIIKDDDDKGIPDSASKASRIGDLAKKAALLSEMLGARWREHGSHLDFDVPLGEGRSHLCEVFVVDSTQPFTEGEALFGVEANVGELTTLNDPKSLLAGIGVPGQVRIALVKSETDMPRVVAQGFLPLARANDKDLAAVIFQVARTADTLEHTIFGGDMG